MRLAGVLVHVSATQSAKERFLMGAASRTKGKAGERKIAAEGTPEAWAAVARQRATK